MWWCLRSVVVATLFAFSSQGLANPQSVGPDLSQSVASAEQSPGAVSTHTSPLLPESSADVVTVDSLLKNAAVALQQKNYRGRFTYEFGSVLETLEVTHAVVDGIEHERILHLSGKKREFLRDGRRDNCLTAGSLLLRGANLRFNGRTQKLADNYHFYIGADDRIAGREASVVQVVPKDDYRYGMTYAFDKSSGLPLLTLTGSAQNTLERFQFVQLEVGIPATRETFTAQEGPYQVLNGEQVPCVEGDVIKDNPTGWRAGWLPSGFVLSQSGSDDKHQAVLTYTDGLASFTLFVRPLDGEAADGFKAGVARRGATIALLQTLKAGQDLLGVVLVGEVPLQTARQVVSSISYRP